MPGNDEKDEALKTPLGSGQQTTPYRTPAPADDTLEFHIEEATARALAERYDLLAEVGRGGMGIVYKARDRETQEIVALKVLKPEIAARPDLIERFKAELRLARKITHKNVCRTYELLRLGDTVVISMEYVAGESLRAVLERFGGVPLRRGLVWVRQICSALAEAHAQGVVHRDLKPENIVITRNGSAKVMDFGIARSLEPSAASTTGTGTGTIIGTPAYMSPEQAEGRPVDPRSDIYALGLILYEMFTGQRAFEAETPMALALKHIHESPSSPRSIDPDLPLRLDRAILKCLEKNPKKRFQSVQELEAALTRAPEPLPTALGEEPAELPLPVHLARWQRRDWALVGLAVLGAFLFFALFDRVFPYGAIQAPMSGSEAIKRTTALVEKYAPELKGLQYRAVYEGVNYLPDFGRLVLEYGLSQALQFGRTYYPSWSVEAKQRARPSAGASFYANGELRSLSLPAPVTLGETEPPWTLEQVLPRATQYAQELFKVKLTGVAPKPLTYDAQSRRWVYRSESFVWGTSGKTTPVWWTLPESAETDRVILLSLAKDRLVMAEQRIALKGSFAEPLPVLARAPQPSQQEMHWLLAQGVGGLFLIFTLILCAFLYFQHRLYTRTSGVVLAMSLPIALGVLLLHWAANGQEDFFWPSVPVVFVLALLVYYALLSVPFHYLGRTLPAQLNTLSHLLRKRLQAQPSGLAAIRGAAFGLIYLALHAGLLWALGTFKLGAARILWFALHSETALIETALRANLPFSLAAPAMIGLLSLLTLGLPLALVRRVTAKPAALLAVATLLWAASAFLLLGATAFPVLPLYFFAILQGLFFSYLFLRYDALTCIVAVFTMETWLLSYAVYRVFGSVEPWTVSWGLVLWWVVLLSGLGLSVLPALRRAAAVFE